jgi:hypothetical protein
MQLGKTLQELAAEVQRQQDVKADFTAPSSAIKLVSHVSLTEGEPGRMTLNLHNGGALNREFSIGKTCHNQLAQRLGVPFKYWERMRAEAPALLADNANHWLARDEKRRMVRTLDGRARAYLSDGYRPLDNFDLCNAVLPAIIDLDLKVKSCEVTERRLYIQVVSERLQGDVKVGDTVQAGFVISNSEIGAGSFRIEELLYRLVCLNGMIVGDVLKKYHAGGKAAGVLDDVAAYYRDTTRQLDDAAFFAKVTDTVRHVVSPERFEATLLRMQGAADVQVKPVEGVALVAKRLDLSDAEQSSVLNHLIEGGDLSTWGMANAVTRLAHDAADYDRAVEYQKLGNDVVELPRSAWKEVDALAA